MKKTHSNKALGGSHDDLRPQYEFDYGKARPNRFATRVTPDTRAVVLDADVAKVFTTPEAVNAVLRALIETMPQKDIREETREHLATPSRGASPRLRQVRSKRASG